MGLEPRLSPQLRESPLPAAASAVILVITSRALIARFDRKEEATDASRAVLHPVLAALTPAPLEGRSSTLEKGCRVSSHARDGSAPLWLLTEDYEEIELGRLKAGKEAEVFVVERVRGERSCLLAHKRYRPK